MFTKITDLERTWKSEIAYTQKILNALTDISLNQAINDDHRTIGRIAWHICGTIPDMINEVGGTLEKIEAPVPSDAKTIQETYRKLAASAVEQITAKLTDADLLEKHEIYGYNWERGYTLLVFINHEIHHRGQLTVLMRQAGLVVPSIYGPAKEGWAAYNAEPPVV